MRISTISTNPEWRMNIELFVKEKLESGRKLKLEKEKIMNKITSSLPPQFQWVEKEGQLETLYAAVKEYKQMFGELQKCQRFENKQIGKGNFTREDRFNNCNSQRGGGFNRGGFNRGGFNKGGFSRGGSYRNGQFRKDTSDSRYCYACREAGKGLVYDHISYNCPNKRAVNNIEEVSGDSVNLITKRANYYKYAKNNISMSPKLHYLINHLDRFPKNCGLMSERFHQAIK